jgi:hypothetical protein
VEELFKLQLFETPPDYQSHIHIEMGFARRLPKSGSANP